MNILYKVKSVQRLGENVRLVLQKEDAIKKEQPGKLEMLSNVFGIVEQMKQDAILSQQPDIVTIPYEEWKKHKYQIDDLIVISVEPAGAKDGN